MANRRPTSEVVGGSPSGPRIEWSYLRSVATDVEHVRGGARVELSALNYNEIVDLVNRDRRRNGEWLELDLARQDDLLLLTATSNTVGGQTIICSQLGLEPPKQDDAETALPNNVVPIRASADQWQTRSSDT